MLIPYWFHTKVGLGYGVTATSKSEAESLLAKFGYLGPNVEIEKVTEGVKLSELDQNHVVPNAGPIVVYGVWYPRHNV